MLENLVRHSGHYKEPGRDATSIKPNAFAKHPADVFQSHPSENELEEEEASIQLLEAPFQL
jgi:hypothetical protein